MTYDPQEWWGNFIYSQHAIEKGKGEIELRAIKALHDMHKARINGMKRPKTRHGNCSVCNDPVRTRLAIGEERCVKHMKHRLSMKATEVA
jgi:hypothetical protein